MRLSARQKEVLQFIEKHQKENGWSPTIREIANAIGVESPATVYIHLKNLEKNGFIQRMPCAPRAIKVLQPYDLIKKACTDYGGDAG